MYMKRYEDNIRKNMPRAYTFAIKYTVEDKHIGICGIFERKKQFNDISEIWKYEICVQESKFWCKGYYADTVGKSTKAIKKSIRNQLSLFDPKNLLRIISNKYMAAGTVNKSLVFCK